jgi:hypothetical protein
LRKACVSIGESDFYQVIIKNPVTGTEFNWFLLLMENLFYDRVPTRILDDDLVKAKHLGNCGREFMKQGFGHDLEIGRGKLCAKWDSKGGKTKSLFLKTLDDRFILKSLSPIETSICHTTLFA